MSFIKYLAGGFVWAVAFYVGFNTPYWLGISSFHIGIIGG